MAGLRGGAPTTESDDEFFWRGVEDGRLLIARCAECSHLQHPPTPMCPNCGSVEWLDQEASGRGTVHSWIVSRHPNGTDDTDEAPRIVVLVQLEEGVRVVSNLREIDPQDVLNDMDVEITFAEVGRDRLPQFRPAPRFCAR
jgi:uncharacterized OB-fold protein